MRLSSFSVIVKVAAVVSFLITATSAVELLTQEQAVKRMFLTAESVKEETKTLSPAQLEKVKKALGGKLYAMKASAGAKDDVYTLYNGLKAGTVTGIAIIEEQEDKWGPLQFIFVIDPATGKITNAAMMKYVDARSRSLADRTFLKSFFGKGVSDPIAGGTDIDAVSGATVSTEILCFMVKKAVAIVSVLSGK
jgi:Na+-translocating ferredoxin:NAD+ oxidoreductase RnfG subunit